MSKRVFVGMSGGVDSSVTAALLLEQGYNVTGVFMKNWAQDLPGFKCPWREDLADAKRVAVQIGIPFKIYDFQKEYKQKVVDYMIAEYQAGRTPNPDIMCNQEVKFKLFLEAALEDGADMIATGHYARAVNGELLRAVDDNKDQTYFLYRVTKEALSKTLFPLGGMKKPDVRKKAADLGLITAAKKDSVGICFVGQIGIKDFLKNYVTTVPGSIIDSATREVIGQHEGAIFYTIGQRHGLDVGGGIPYYVIGKDMTKNEVYVTTDINDGVLWQSKFNVADVHWINPNYQIPSNNYQFQVRTRHRAPLISCTISEVGDILTVQLKDEIRALTPGQSAVFYDGDVCTGGGVII
ncbi:tRNA 2-thiouridine(34) synthase MnmA [Candidatus Saccharibacteria bacterium]|nr:tRNA 2-thiouridine(34) synthase MnmA [Candidatus Saccharibacteria bacterium]